MMLMMTGLLLLQSCGKRGQRAGDVPVGVVRVTDLANNPKYGWFRSGYQEYEPDSMTIERIRPYNMRTSVDIFMGTWCPDTRRELPRFIKVLDEADIPSQNVTMYGLDKQKQGVGDLTAQQNIEAVPTMIVYYKGREVGRIVERTNRPPEEILWGFLQGME